MKMTALNPTAFFLFLIGAVAAQASTEEKLHQHFAAQPGGMVVVEVDFGAIGISTHATGEVVVDVWRKIGLRTQADEAAFLRDNSVKFV